MARVFFAGARLRRAAAFGFALSFRFATVFLAAFFLETFFLPAGLAFSFG